MKNFLIIKVDLNINAHSGKSQQITSVIKLFDGKWKRKWKRFNLNFYSFYRVAAFGAHYDKSNVLSGAIVN